MKYWLLVSIIGSCFSLSCSHSNFFSTKLMTIQQRVIMNVEQLKERKYIVEHESTVKCRMEVVDKKKHIRILVLFRYFINFMKSCDLRIIWSSERVVILYLPLSIWRGLLYWYDAKIYTNRLFVWIWLIGIFNMSKYDGNGRI